MEQIVQQHCRILVVENEDAIQELLTTFLEMLNYDVTMISTGDQALRLFDAVGVRLVLVDEYLPDAPGHTLVEAMRLCRPDLKLLLMSTDTNVRCLARGVGADGFWNMESVFELRKQIETLLGQPKPLVVS